MLAGAGEPTADQLLVQAESTWRHGRSGTLVAGRLQVPRRGHAAGARGRPRRPRRARPPGGPPVRRPRPGPGRRRPRRWARRRAAPVRPRLPRPWRRAYSSPEGGRGREVSCRRRPRASRPGPCGASRPSLRPATSRRRRPTPSPRGARPPPWPTSPRARHARRPWWAPGAVRRVRTGWARRRWRRSGPADARSSSADPVSTSSDGTPTAWAPSMSVSSRSPTISGRSPPTRRTVSSISGRAGLPATVGRHPGEPCDRVDEHAVPGGEAVGGRGWSCPCCSRRREVRRAPAWRPA